MPKIPPVDIADYIKFLTKFLGLVLVKVKGSHHCYDNPIDPKLPRRIEIAIHNSKEIPGIYVKKTLKQFDIEWEDFLEIIKKL
jgi:predicted RNA binding protein YcfA (HicA-like mRNA interferase family)